MITLTDRDILELLRTNNLRRDTLEEDVVAALDALHRKVATAESCTGGLVSERITRVSGSSRVFDCGVCSYANAIKAKVLGVSEETASEDACRIEHYISDETFGAIKNRLGRQ